MIAGELRKHGVKKQLHCLRMVMHGGNMDKK